MVIEQRGSQPTNRDDISCLAESHSTDIRTVNKLLSVGIPLDAADEVLDIRDQLSYSWKEEGGQVRQDIASVEAIAFAYHTVGGNLDTLSLIAEKSQDRIGQIMDTQAIQEGMSGKKVIINRIKSGTHTAVLLGVTKEYIKTGSLALKEDL